MKRLFFVLAAIIVTCPPVLGQPGDVAIPAIYRAAIKATDFVAVSGTNDLGGAENFTIHNSKAINQFIEFLTSDRYTSVPRSLNPHFKSLSVYFVQLSSKGAPILKLRVIADTILDIPNETAYYMQSDRHSDNLMAPLLRLR